MIVVSIRQKIVLLVSFVLLLFGIAVGGYFFIQRQMADEVDGFYRFHIPISSGIASIEIRSMASLRYLREEVELARKGKNHSYLMNRYEHQRLAEQSKLEEIFPSTIHLINEAKESEVNDLPDRLEFARISGSLQSVSQQYTSMASISNKVIEQLNRQNFTKIDALLEDLNNIYSTYSLTLAGIRLDIDTLISESNQESKEQQEKILIFGFGIYMLAAIVGLLFAFVMSGHMVLGLRRLIESVKNWENGDYSLTLASKTKDEIGELSKSFNSMAKELASKEKIKETFGKYVDARVVAEILGNNSFNDRADRQLATILFSDIKGFTNMSETLTASTMVKLLNTYFTDVAELIHERNGIIDKYIGDSVMAFWTTPFSKSETHATQACLAAIAQQQVTKKFHSELPELLGLKRHSPDFSVRIGLTTGEVVVGTIGADRAKSFTVIGDRVNLASRLESANKVYGTMILTDEATYRSANDAIEFRELDQVIVVGKIEPVRIYEVLGVSDSLSQEMINIRETYAQGLDNYYRGQWDLAERAFFACLQSCSADGPSKAMLSRISFLKASSSINTWDGIWKMENK